MSMSSTRKVFDDAGNFVIPVLECKDKSLAKQSMQAECDINNILKGYDRTGLISHLNDNPGFFGDVASVPDFQAALAIVEKADFVFSELPSQLRTRFENDPAKYLAFVSDPANREEMIALGLIDKPKEAVAAPTVPAMP